MKNIFCINLRLNLLTGLFVIGILFQFSCSKPEAPEYLGFRDFSIRQVNMDSALLHTQLTFYNPNAFLMELKRGDVNVYLDDQLANHYIMDTSINIPKKDTFYVPLDLKVSPKLLLGSAIKMLLNDNKIKVRLVGSVRVKRSGVGFTVPIDYEVMQSIK